jgi:AmmeMemoRadiSam system protein B
MISRHPSLRVRAPAAAGTFYPRSAETLRRTVDTLLLAAQVEERTNRCGVIVPHAGYAYSGSVAAEGFASVRRLQGSMKRTVVIGPAHFVPFFGLAAPSSTVFTTPFGEVPVDVAAVEALSEEALVAINDAPHAPEHAIEVEMPFLQAIFGNLPIVPLLFGSTSARAVAAAIARLWADDTLLVVSTDLSHFEDYQLACQHDKRTAAAIEAFDEAAIGPYDACGHLAVRGALIEASRRGLVVERLALCNSGDATGDRQSVVGYGAWAFHAAP